MSGWTLRILRTLGAALRSVGRDILRGMRIKYALQRGGVSRCTNLMTRFYTQPRQAGGDHPPDSPA